MAPAGDLPVASTANDPSEATDGEPIYTLVCTDTAPYANWQCQVLAHTWHAAGQPGELVRLVAAPLGGPLPTHRHARVVRTRARNVHPRSGDRYVPYNRLFSALEWLRTERPVGTVLLVDPDVVFRAPVTRGVAPGAPRAQRWVGFNLTGSVAEDVVVRETGVAAGDLQGVTWPALIHTADLEVLLPRWIELTADVREATGLWESDMIAFVGAAAEMGLRFTPATIAAFVNWSEEEVAGAPIIHYCQPVEDADGNILWTKHHYRPWDRIDVDPRAARLDYCRDLLAILQEAVSALGSRSGVNRGG